MMKRAVGVAVLAMLLALGCSSPDRKFSQLPLHLRVFVVQNDRVHMPRSQFTGPFPGDITPKAAIPGDPWSEAAKVIAQAVSDCFKYGYHAGEVGATMEDGWSTTTFRLVDLSWGEGIDLKRIKMMWEAYSEFLLHLPDVVPMYNPRMSLEGMMGWMDAPLPAGPSVIVTPMATVPK